MNSILDIAFIVLLGEMLVISICGTFVLLKAFISLLFDE